MLTTIPATLPPLRMRNAAWLTRFHGAVELSRDLPADATPPLELAPPAKLRRVFRIEPRRWARFAGYYFEDAAGSGLSLVFLLWPELYPQLDLQREEVRVAGDFNKWAPDARWTLREETLAGETALVLHITGSTGVTGVTGSTDSDNGENSLPAVPATALFKFVTASGHWLEPPSQAPNRARDSRGNTNLRLDASRTGRHVLVFATATSASLVEHERVIWREPDNEHDIVVHDGDFLLHQDTTLELGARVRRNRTTFRIFAPRATAVRLELEPPAATGSTAGGTSANSATRTVSLSARGDGVWEAHFPENLHGWRYRYFVDGDNTDASTAFNVAEPILDPWALAALSPAGPALVIDAHRVAAPARQFRPPAPTDAVIVEAHIRDVLASGGGDRTEQSDFRRLAAALRSPDFYLRRLGANVLELLPVTEFERGADASEYHWGYMPVNWCAPASAYAGDAAAGTQIADLQDLVNAAHDAGIAVVLDVVFNHLGSPNALLRLDKTYFLETADDGALSNWSGCGNDFRPDTPLGRKLVLETLRHLIELYDVDGFRFDLAELLGLPLLREIERNLRPLKPGLLLIAEPWSFRGHIGAHLARTGYAAWNDGFREFLPALVHNAGDTAGLRHFLAGSPATPLSAPHHTLNYTQSHDDRCWLDRITENSANNGFYPTAGDARRTRLMAAVLFASLGAPMLAAGQDFLHSKRGVSNTYQRGDLNALDYARLEKFRDTHEYFRAWIAFRLSAAGAALRLPQRPADGFFKFFVELAGDEKNTAGSSQKNALAALYNADERLVIKPLLFAINPAPTPVTLTVAGVAPARFRQLADADRFVPAGLPAERRFRWEAGRLTLPALSCGLWLGE